MLDRTEILGEMLKSYPQKMWMNCHGAGYE